MTARKLFPRARAVAARSLSAGTPRGSCFPAHGPRCPQGHRMARRDRTPIRRNAARKPLPRARTTATDPPREPFPRARPRRDPSPVRRNAARKPLSRARPRRDPQPVRRNAARKPFPRAKNHRDRPAARALPPRTAPPRPVSCTQMRRPVAQTAQAPPSPAATPVAQTAQAPPSPPPRPPRKTAALPLPSFGRATPHSRRSLCPSAPFPC